MSENLRGGIFFDSHCIFIYNKQLITLHVISARCSSAYYILNSLQAECSACHTINSIKTLKAQRGSTSTDAYKGVILFARNPIVKLRKLSTYSYSVHIADIHSCNYVPDFWLEWRSPLSSSQPCLEGQTLHLERDRLCHFLGHCVHGHGNHSSALQTQQCPTKYKRASTEHFEVIKFATCN